MDTKNVELTIQDQGRGFGQKLEEPTKVGVGIAGMRERVRELGGEFKIDSTPSGATITATVPLQEKLSHVATNSSSR
jgi:two-component system, NarL family, sensor histidine kinase UhpB